MSFDSGSRSKLSPRDLPRFAGDTLFQRIARQVCEADCLARKELYESWEVARRTRRRFRGGRVLDLACGHGLLGQLLLLLDDSSPNVLGIDARLPCSAQRLQERLRDAWPRLGGRVELIEGRLSQVEAQPGDLLVSCHACGSLTDDVLRAAVRVRAKVVVLPCCQDARLSDQGGLGGWLESSLAIDVTRAAHLQQHGYTVHTQTISAQITPKNRLLLAEPNA